MDSQPQPGFIAQTRASLSMRTLRRRLNLAERLGIKMLHTARPISFYRRVFFPALSIPTLLTSLKDQRVIDLACGYTPYSEDSFFQNCVKAGVDIFGVDPVLSEHPSFTVSDQILARLLGSRSGLRSHLALYEQGTSAERIDSDEQIKDHERLLPYSAQDLPFSKESVDLLLCSYLLFVWIHDQQTLSDCFTSVARVLRTGGVAKFYPADPWHRLPLSPDTRRAILAEFEVSETFVNQAMNPQLVPAMCLTLKKT